MWLSCWQCNKTHTLCNSRSQQRKKKKEQLVSCAASTCRAAEQRLAPGDVPAHPESLSATCRGSPSHGASPHQARRHSWQRRDRSPKNPPCSGSGTQVHVKGTNASYWVYAMTEIFGYCLQDINVKSYFVFSRSRAGTLHGIGWVAEWKMHATWKLSSKLILKNAFGKICRHFHLYRWIKKDTCK